jgi:protein-disulfide isomerase
MKSVICFAGKLALTIALFLPLGAEEQAITRQQADQILDELRQIRALLQKQGDGSQPEQRPRVKMDLTGAPLLGSEDAPITLVEFADLQCLFCRKFHTTAFQELKKNYIDTGRLRFYSRDLPLEAMHPDAQRAAQAARCAGDQGRFWELRDTMAVNPDKLGLDKLLLYAKHLNLDVDRIRDCVEKQKYKEAVQKDLSDAERIGAQGTPSFVLGRSSPEGVDGELMVGAVPYAEFDRRLKEILH